MTHRLNKPNRYLLPLIAFLVMPFNHTALAQQPTVVVKAYGQHVGGNIIYQQQVTNNGSRDVMTIAIAEDTDQGESTLPATRDSGELNAFPAGSDMIDTEVNPASISGPTGWTGSIIQIQDSGLFFEWRRPRSPLLPLKSGQTLRFSITVPTYDEAYLTGHFSAGFGDGNDPWYYNGVMEKLDVTPPTLTVNLSPATIWPPNDKLISVAATITVKDDYDPQPEIKLESITANEVLDKDDVKGVQPGTDDRSFKLRAERKGNNDNHKKADRLTKQLGRIYTVTYSATDGSGNKTTASASVTVPHDGREKEGRRGEKSGKSGKNGKD
jgi:hypothetical protein